MYFDDIDIHNIMNIYENDESNFPFHNESKVLLPYPVLEPKFDLVPLIFEDVKRFLLSVTPVEYVFFILALILPRNKSDSNWSIMFKYRKISKTLQVLEDAVIEAIKAVFGLATLVIISPIVGPILLIFYIISEIVRAIFRYRYGKSATKAAGQDAIWGNETVESRPFIVVGITMRGTPDVEKIRETFVENILGIKDKKGRMKHRKFCQLITTELGYYIWKDAPDFNIKNHIRVWKDPSNAVYEKDNDEGSTGTENLISRYLDQYGSDPLPVNRPQWEAVILDSKNAAEGKYPVIMRLHHSIGDGVSLVRLIVGSLSDTPLVLPSVGAPAIHPALKLLTFVWAISLLPLELLRTYSNKDVNPFHGSRLNGRKKFLLAKGIKLQTLKEIKTAYGATINDVLMSCLSAALARTFCKCWQFYTPEVTAMIPISYHDLTEEVNLINSFLIPFLKLPTPLPSDVITPRERLLRVKKQCDDMKRDPGMMALYYASQFMCVIFPAKLVEYLFSLRGLTMGASNVPGPQDEVRFFGDPMDGVGFWVPDRSPTGAGVGMISYGGMVRVGIMVDGGLVGDKKEIEQVAKEFHQEVANLYNAIESKTKLD